jgi:hypothetical protein
MQALNGKRVVVTGGSEGLAQWLMRPSGIIPLDI